MRTLSCPWRKTPVRCDLNSIEYNRIAIASSIMCGITSFILSGFLVHLLSGTVSVVSYSHYELLELLFLYYFWVGCLKIYKLKNKSLSVDMNFTVKGDCLGFWHLWRYDYKAFHADFIQIMFCMLDYSHTLDTPACSRRKTEGAHKHCIRGIKNADHFLPQKPTLPSLNACRAGRDGMCACLCKVQPPAGALQQERVDSSSNNVSMGRSGFEARWTLHLCTECVGAVHGDVKRDERLWYEIIFLRGYCFLRTPSSRPRSVGAN